LSQGNKALGLGPSIVLPRSGPLVAPCLGDVPQPQRPPRFHGCRLYVLSRFPFSFILLGQFFFRSVFFFFFGWISVFQWKMGASCVWCLFFDLFAPSPWFSGCSFFPSFFSGFSWGSLVSFWAHGTGPVFCVFADGLTNAFGSPPVRVWPGGFDPRGPPACRFVPSSCR